MRRTLAKTVGVAGQIEPVPSPALAEAGGFQKPVNDLLESKFGLVADEGLDVFWLRGEAGDIEEDPPQEGVTVGPRGGG